MMLNDEHTEVCSWNWYNKCNSSAMFFPFSFSIESMEYYVLFHGFIKGGEMVV